MRADDATPPQVAAPRPPSHEAKAPRPGKANGWRARCWPPPHPTWRRSRRRRLPSPAAEQHAALAESTLRTGLGETERALEWHRRRVRERAAAAAVLRSALRLLRRCALMRDLVEAGDHLLWPINNWVLRPRTGMSYDPTVDDLPTRVRRMSERLHMSDTWRSWARRARSLSEAGKTRTLPASFAGSG